MGMSLSNNLRVRIVEAVLAGLSRRRAVARFGVSVTEFRTLLSQNAHTTGERAPSRGRINLLPTTLGPIAFMRP